MPGISEVIAASAAVPQWSWVMIGAAVVALALDSDATTAAVGSVGRLAATLSVRLQLLAGSVGVGFLGGLTVPPESLPLVGGML